MQQSLITKETQGIMKMNISQVDKKKDKKPELQWFKQAI